MVPRITALNVIPKQITTLNVIPKQITNPISDHVCYILQSCISNKTYIGYTVNFSRRIRQHNGEIQGGAKKTRKWRPWTPVCVISGFYDSSSALRFEYRLQHPHRRRRAKENAVTFTLETLAHIISNGDGSIEKDNKIPWPILTIQWHIPDHIIQHSNIINIY